MLVRLLGMQIGGKPELPSSIMQVDLSFANHLDIKLTLVLVSSALQSVIL